MRVEIAETPFEQSDAELLCIGLHDGEELPAWLAEAPGSADVKTDLKSLTILRPEGRRVLVVGLGDRDGSDPDRLRAAAALAVAQARRLAARSVAWRCPDGRSAPAALTSGTILASYRFDRFKRAADDPPAELELLALHEPSDPAAADEIVPVAKAGAEAANRARDLQNMPANLLGPAGLAERAREIAAASERVEVEVLDRARLEEEGFGGLLAVGAGSAQDPLLIVLRYSGGGPKLGFVGKGVTFDSGGISIKPSQGMELMKKDMTGGAAVLEATAAIAELGLGVDVIAVVPAVENMPSGSAMRPGDIITQLDGTTVEVNNTDAEGRLILADALTWCAREGAERIVDVATLTGAIMVALGSTYAGLFADDDEWAARIEGAGRITGELVWRMPLHREYAELTRGTYADISNSAAKREAGAIYAAEFLKPFAQGVPWAHLDIAGTSWDVPREYLGKGATGFGARLLLELARDAASAAAA
jgi:leucyl aminopeptidase